MAKIEIFQTSKHGLAYEVYRGKVFICFTSYVSYFEDKLKFSNGTELKLDGTEKIYKNGELRKSYYTPKPRKPRKIKTGTIAEKWREYKEKNPSTYCNYSRYLGLVRKEGLDYANNYKRKNNSKNFKVK